METYTTPANVSNLLNAAAYVRNETIINGTQAAQLDAMTDQIKDLAAKIEAVPAKIAELAAQGKEKAAAMWERMAARYEAQFADAVATLRAWLVDFKTNRPNVQINLDEPEQPEPTNPTNTPNVSELARWIDLQLTTIIEGVSAGYTLGNCNSVWIDKGATVFNVSLANGETVAIDSDNYNTAEEIANAIIATLNNTSATMNATEATTAPESSELSPAAKCLTMYLDNTPEIYDRYTVPAIGACAKAQAIKTPEMWEYIKKALKAAAGLVRKYDHIAPTPSDIEQAAHDYVAYIVECAQYEIANA